MRNLALRAMPGFMLAAGLAACGAHRPARQESATLTAFSSVASPKDAFSGQSAGASGQVAGAHGSVRVDLHPSRASGTRKVTVTISSPPCHGDRRCVALAGTLTGTLRDQAPRPDRGRSSALHVTGRLSPLGPTSGTGQVTGTGNVRFGRESLSMTLTSRRGTVHVVAHSGQVSGFTSP